MSKIVNKRTTNDVFIEVMIDIAQGGGEGESKEMKIGTRDYGEKTTDYERKRGITEGNGRLRTKMKNYERKRRITKGNGSYRNKRKIKKCKEDYERKRKITKGNGRLRKETEDYGRLRKETEDYGRKRKLQEQTEDNKK